MKRTYLIFSLALLFSLQCCNKEEVPATSKSKITFSLNIGDDSIGRKQSSSLSGSSVVLSIETSAGDPVLSNYSIKLLSFGDAYITDQLELAIGNYVITNFMVVDDSSNVLFATPQKNSSLSQLVTHPLPHGFNVSANSAANIQMEVVLIGDHLPQDFGYASFQVKIVRPLSIAVFTSDNALPTTAKAFIVKDNDTLSTYALEAKVNTLSFKQDPMIAYKLVILKDGYKSFSKIFIYNDLKAELNAGTLKVYLTSSIDSRYGPNLITGGGFNSRDESSWTFTHTSLDAPAPMYVFGATTNLPSSSDGKGLLISNTPGREPYIGEGCILSQQIELVEAGRYYFSVDAKISAGPAVISSIDPIGEWGPNYHSWFQWYLGPDAPVEFEFFSGGDGILEIQKDLIYGNAWDGPFSALDGEFKGAAVGTIGKMVDKDGYITIKTPGTYYLGLQFGKVGSGVSAWGFGSYGPNGIGVDNVSLRKVL